MRKQLAVSLGVAAIVACLIYHYEKKGAPRVKKGPSLTGWHRSVVQDGPAVAARWQKTIERALATHHSRLPPNLIVGFVLTESMGKSHARNQSGAAGLMGVKPVVCKALRVKRCNLLNPHENIALGVRYLQLLQKYGFEDEKLILAYGVGPGRAREILKKNRFRAHRSTYVRRVLYARSLGKTDSAKS